MPEFRSTFALTGHFSISLAALGYGGEIQIGPHIDLFENPDAALILTIAPALASSPNLVWSRSTVVAYETQFGMSKLSIDELLSEKFESYSINTPWGGGEIVYDARGREVTITGGGPWVSAGSGVLATRPNSYRLLRASELGQWTIGSFVKTYQLTKKSLQQLFE